MLQFDLLKPIIEHMSWADKRLHPETPQPEFHWVSRQQTINGLIAQYYRNKHEIRTLRNSVFDVYVDDWKDSRRKQILNVLDRTLDPEANWSPAVQMLGAEKVEGEKATGDNVCRTFLRIMIRNHHSISLLEHVEMDGGSNFKGKKERVHCLAIAVARYWGDNRYFFFFFFFFLLLFFFF
jgi:hypothetical protein